MAKKVLKSNDSRQIDRDRTEKIVNSYIYVILCLLPLVFWHYYKDIVNVKYFFYVGCSIALILLVCIFTIVSYRTNKYEKQTHLALDKKKSFRSFLKKTTLPEKMMVGFVLVALISTLQSDYFFESFWGNEGRLTGLFLIMIYGACFLILGRLSRLEERMLDSFLVVGNFVCLFGITDYFQLDIFHFKQNIVPDQKLMFTSTIGNVNLYTIFAAMVVAVAMILFASEKKLKIGKRTFYYVTMVIAMTGLLMGQSDNAYLSLLALFGLSPLYLFRYKAGIARYVTAIASFFTIVLSIKWMDQTIPGAIGLSSVVPFVSGIRVFPAFVILLWIAAAAGLWITKNSGKEEASVWWKRGWIILICLAVAAVLFVLYDCNVAGHADRYGAIQNYVLFNDKWGTNRGFIWRIALEVYEDYPWYRKLVGFGPDTFGLAVYHKYLPQMLEFSGEIYDSAHNEYIQYLVTLGAAGLFFYLILIFSSIKRMTRSKKPEVIAILFALLCYWFQAIVNINIPITAPIMWTLWGLGLSASRER